VSAWKREGGIFFWRVVVPANTRATIHLPCEDVHTATESGRPVGRVRELTLCGTKPGWAILEIGSGEYAFSSRLTAKQRSAQFSTLSAVSR